MAKILLTLHHYVEGSRTDLEALRRRIREVWDTDEDLAVPLNGSGPIEVWASDLLSIGEVEEG